jgi:hypothetical protein
MYIKAELCNRKFNLLIISELDYLNIQKLSFIGEVCFQPIGVRVN